MKQIFLYTSLAVMALAVTTTGAAPEPCDGTVQFTSQSNFQDDKAVFVTDLRWPRAERRGATPGRRACELVPISKDALVGIDFAIHFAQIYAWTGEKDLAIEQIEMVQRFPNPLSYGLLKLAVIRASKKSSPRSHRNSPTL